MSRKLIHVRLTPEEKQICLKAASQDEICLAAWMRRTLMKEARKLLNLRPPNIFHKEEPNE